MTNHQSVLPTGTTGSGRSHRKGVTRDEAEHAPRLRVPSGEDSKESKPPITNRVETHTAKAYDSSPPVPWRWHSRPARIIRSHRPQCRSKARSGELQLATMLVPADGKPLAGQVLPTIGVPGSAMHRFLTFRFATAPRPAQLVVQSVGPLSPGSRIRRISLMGIPPCRTKSLWNVSNL